MAPTIRLRRTTPAARRNIYEELIDRSEDVGFERSINSPDAAPSVSASVQRARLDARRGSARPAGARPVKRR